MKFIHAIPMNVVYVFDRIVQQGLHFFPKIGMYHPLLIIHVQRYADGTVENHFRVALSQ